MNYSGFWGVLLGFGVLGLTCRYLTPRETSPPVWLWALAVFLALPAFVYAFYYSRLLGEPIWLYRLRAFPGTEMLAATAGFLAGFVQVRVIPQLRLSPIGKKAIVPMIFGFALLLPYLKPICRPLRADSLRNVWADNVCHQSSSATCGPASAATILRQLGINATERELAQEAYSSASGTENWYLARAIRRRGLEVKFISSGLSNAPLPALAGVKLLSTGGAGHFVALLGQTNECMVIADPLEGRRTVSLEELTAKYEFTGFFLAIRTRAE